ncbi:MAG: hypothetical protein CMJ18_03380 [Phycisphaeraceae bacterium]|nr:hypothetical protein [Phycisphaeraceae bacterium]
MNSSTTPCVKSRTASWVKSRDSDDAYPSPSGKSVPVSFSSGCDSMKPAIPTPCCFAMKAWLSLTRNPAMNLMPRRCAWSIRISIGWMPCSIMGLSR